MSSQLEIPRKIRQIPHHGRKFSFRFHVALWFIGVVLFSLGPGVAIGAIVYLHKVGDDNDAILVELPLNEILFLVSVVTSVGGLVACMWIYQ
jgi:hypothetical protein